MPDPSRSPAQLALVLGTGDIASAIGWHLHHAGHVRLRRADAPWPCTPPRIARGVPAALLKVTAIAAE